MKLVVFSDAHGNRNLVDRILDFNPDADYILSLGDSGLDPDYLRRHDIVHVKGNIPRDAGTVYDAELTVGNRRVLLTHGHKYKVHRTLDRLIKHAVSNQFDIVLYGHTHIAHVERFGSLLVVNPGSCASPRDARPPSYAVLTLEDDRTNVVFKDVLTNRIIE
jgi:putative phosphoesterase